jgi:organic radical activating enzyme
MPNGQLSTEVDEICKTIDISKITDIKQLPLAKTGCDSYVAIDKRFRHLSKVLTGKQLTEKILGDLDNDVTGYDLVFTGGEPLLKANQVKLVKWFKDNLGLLYGSRHVTFETNGTQKITEDLNNFITSDEGRRVEWTFSISPKISCSGVPREKAIVGEPVLEIVDLSKQPNVQCYLKFVVSDESQIAEIDDIVGNEYNTAFTNDQIMLMPCGGTIEEYDRCAKRVVEYCMKRRFRFCDRVHLRVFKNAWAT